VGWADNLRLVTIGKVNPRMAISATFKVLRECLDLVKQYPRRSVELWTEDLIIDPIALLSTSRPAKNLGLMTFECTRSGAKLTKYYETGATMDASNAVIADRDTLVKLIVSTIEQSEIGQYVRTQMSAPEPEPVAEEPVADEPMADDPVADEPVVDEAEAVADVDSEDATAEPPVKDKPVAGELVKHEMDGEVETAEADVDEELRQKGLADEREEHPELSDDDLLQLVDDHLAEDAEYYTREKCEEALAGGSNTDVPEELKEKNAMKDVLHSEVLERYRKENNSLKDEVTQLAKHLKAFAREKELFQLNQVFAFDLKDELAITGDYSDDQFTRHCEVIKTRYSKYPVNRGVGVSPMPTDEGVKPAMSLARVQQAVAVAQAEKCSFEEALKRV
jgi:hypothetical protein